jgi:hypothetical protein
LPVVALPSRRELPLLVSAASDAAGGVGCLWGSDRYLLPGSPLGETGTALGCFSERWGRSRLSLLAESPQNRASSFCQVATRIVVHAHASEGCTFAKI